MNPHHVFKRVHKWRRGTQIRSPFPPLYHGKKLMIQDLLDDVDGKNLSCIKEFSLARLDENLKCIFHWPVVRFPRPRWPWIHSTWFSSGNIYIRLPPRCGCCHGDHVHVHPWRSVPSNLVNRPKYWFQWPKIWYAYLGVSVWDMKLLWSKSCVCLRGHFMNL